MMQIFNTFKAFFQSPIFEGDEEKTQGAKLLYQIISIVWGLPILLIFIMVLNATARREVIPPAVVISITLLGLMLITRRGWIGVANTIITSMIVLVFMYADFQNAGNIQPSTLVIAIAIIMSGLLLGRRAPLVVALFIALVHGVIVSLQLRGAIQVVSAPAVGVENIIITGIMILMIAFLFQFVMARLQLAVNQARKDEEEVRTLSKSLEQRITERTKEMEGLQAVSSKRAVELQSVAEIATKASQAKSAQALLQTVVEDTKDAYKLYHAHIYLMDENKTKLVLAAGAGEAGRQMVAEKRSIALDHQHSLVARAARTNSGAISNNVTQEPDFLPNPLLPDTKSEMAIPITAGDEVLGVLDVQADFFNRFTNEDVAIKTTLAQQVATSLQNIRSFERAEQSLRDLNSQRYALDQHSIVAITDVTGKITYANDKFIEISKYSREELIGQDHRILNSGYHSKEFIRNLWVTIANGKVFHAEIKNKAKDGSLYWVDTTIVPFLNEQGKPYQYVAIRTDITQRKLNEELIAKRAIELETVAAINEKIQSTSTIEAALQVAARELGHALGQKQTAVSLDVDGITDHS